MNSLHKWSGVMWIVNGGGGVNSRGWWCNGVKSGEWLGDVNSRGRGMVECRKCKRHHCRRFQEMSILGQHFTV